MNKEYLDQVEAHLDEGGKLTHVNALELFNEVKRLRALTEAASAAWRPCPYKKELIEECIRYCKAQKHPVANDAAVILSSLLLQPPAAGGGYE